MTFHFYSMHLSPFQDFLNGADLGWRCDLPENLLKRGCEAESMERWETKVVVNTTISSTQVSPGDISITLTPGRQTQVQCEMGERC